MLGETNNETSTTPNQSQNKSKINNSLREFIKSILEAAIAKTNAEEKESTREESSDPLLTEKEKVEEPIEITKIKYVGFLNYKWTEILVEDEEESQEIDRNEIKKAIIQMMKREENNPQTIGPTNLIPSPKWNTLR